MHAMEPIWIRHVPSINCNGWRDGTTSGESGPSTFIAFGPRLLQLYVHTHTHAETFVERVDVVTGPDKIYSPSRGGETRNESIGGRVKVMPTAYVATRLGFSIRDPEARTECFVEWGRGDGFSEEGRDARKL